MKMVHVILDTNFFMIAHKNKIDIIEEIQELVTDPEIETFEGVIKELESIEKSSKGQDGVAAGVGLKLIGEKPIQVLEQEKENVDDAIVEFARENENTVVATADRELKKRLRENDVSLICMRSQKKLEYC